MKTSRAAFGLVTLALTIVINECSPTGILPDTPCKVNGKPFSKGQVILLSKCSGARCGAYGNLSFFVDLQCSLSKFKRSFSVKRSEKKEEVREEIPKDRNE